MFRNLSSCSFISPQYYPFVLKVCGWGGGGFLVPLISTRYKLIKSISAQGVGGATVLFAQFKCFITNFRSFLTFCRVHSSFINNKQNPSLMYMGLEQPPSDPVGGVELPLCSLSRQGHEGLEMIKIWIFPYTVWGLQRYKSAWDIQSGFLLIEW